MNITEYTLYRRYNSSYDACYEWELRRGSDVIYWDDLSSSAYNTLLKVMRDHKGACLIDLCSKEIADGWVVIATVKLMPLDDTITGNVGEVLL